MTYIFLSLNKTELWRVKKAPVEPYYQDPSMAILPKGDEWGDIEQPVRLAYDVSSVSTDSVFLGHLELLCALIAEVYNKKL